MQKKLISDDLYVEDKLNKLKPITEYTQTIEELEGECETMQSRLEAEASLRKVGVHVLGKSGGEIMLLAACHGLISVTKFFAPQVNISYKNSFDDNLLHYAAKGGQAKMTLYLLLKGLDPQSMNKFMETPIFLAAEAGHIEVVNILAKDPRTNLEH
jgi:ankyrin repeat protein